MDLSELTSPSEKREYNTLFVIILCVWFIFNAIRSLSLLVEEHIFHALCSAFLSVACAFILGKKILGLWMYIGIAAIVSLYEAYGLKIDDLYVAIKLLMSLAIVGGVLQLKKKGRSAWDILKMDMQEVKELEKPVVSTPRPLKSGDTVVTPNGKTGITQPRKVEGRVAVSQKKEDISQKKEVQNLKPVSTEKQREETLKDSEEQISYPLDKKGRIDFHRIEDPTIFAEALVLEFGEEADDVIEELIEEEEEKLKNIVKVNDVIERMRLKKKYTTELKKLHKVQECLIQRTLNDWYVELTKISSVKKYGK